MSAFYAAAWRRASIIFGIFGGPEQPAEQTDGQIDGDGVSAEDAFGDHETKKDPVGLKAIVADGIEIVVEESGRAGAVFEKREREGKAGDGVEIRVETSGDGEAVERIWSEESPAVGGGGGKDWLREDAAGESHGFGLSGSPWGEVASGEEGFFIRIGNMEGREIAAAPVFGSVEPDVSGCGAEIGGKKANAVDDGRLPARLTVAASLEFVVVDRPRPFRGAIVERGGDDGERKSVGIFFGVPKDAKAIIDADVFPKVPVGPIPHREKGGSESWPHPDAVEIINPSLAGVGLPVLPRRPLLRPLGFKGALDRAKIVALDFLLWRGDEIRLLRPPSGDLATALEIEIGRAA